MTPSCNGLLCIKLTDAQDLLITLACLTQVPPFDSALPGITIMTLMELIPEVRLGFAFSAGVRNVVTA